MLNLLNIFLLVFCSLTVIFPQTTTQQIDYSESVPYPQSEIKDSGIKPEKDEKPKNDSKSKSEDENKKGSLKSLANYKLSINIPVSVIDANQLPVTDLKETDFRLYVDDKEREISVFDVKPESQNIILIIDVSPSSAYQIKDIKNFASELAASLKSNDKIQIITFSHMVKVLTELTNDRKIIEKAISKIDINEGTSLYESIVSIYKKQISKIEGQKTVILLTDGVDSTSLEEAYDTSLLEAEKYDAVVFPFYLDTYIPNSKNQANSFSKGEYAHGRRYLTDLAALSGGRILTIDKLSSVNKAKFETLFEKIPPQYYIGFSENEIKDLKQRKRIKVRVNRPNLLVKARGSYIIRKNN